MMMMMIASPAATVKAQLRRNLPPARTFRHFRAWFRIGHFWVTTGEQKPPALVRGQILVAKLADLGRRLASPDQARCG